MNKLIRRKLMEKPISLIHLIEMLLEDHNSNIDPKQVYNLFRSTGAPPKCRIASHVKIIGCSAVLAQWSKQGYKAFLKRYPSVLDSIKFRINSAVHEVVPARMRSGMTPLGKCACFSA